MPSWTETSPGTYKSAFDGAERIFRKISTLFAPLGREHFAPVCIISLSLGPALRDPDTAASALRRAWKAVGLQYPGLSVVPDGLDRKIYRVLDEARTETWLNETFFVEPERTVDQVAAAAAPRDLPSLTFVPATAQLVLLTSHWRIDALGICVVLDRLLTVAASSEPAPAAHITPALAALSPSLENAAGLPESYSADADAYGQAVIERFHRDAVQKGGMRFRGTAADPPSAPMRTTLAVPQSSTTALVRACKARGISVTAAVHAALAQAVFALADAAHARDDYTSAMAVNLRGKLQAPYADARAHACQTYVIGIATRVGRDVGFVDSARELTGEYRGRCDAQFMGALRPIYKHHWDALFGAKKAAAPTASPAPPPSGITLSSLGVVESQLAGSYGAGERTVQVRAFDFGVSMMTRQMLLYVWTFGGRLQLSVSYNAAYYDQDAARDVVTRIVGVLGAELGVPIDLEDV